MTKFVDRRGQEKRNKEKKRFKWPEMTDVEQNIFEILCFFLVGLVSVFCPYYIGQVYIYFFPFESHVVANIGDTVIVAYWFLGIISLCIGFVFCTIGYGFFIMGKYFFKVYKLNIKGISEKTRNSDYPSEFVKWSYENFFNLSFEQILELPEKIRKQLTKEQLLYKGKKRKEYFDEGTELLKKMGRKI